METVEHHACAARAAYGAGRSSHALGEAACLHVFERIRLLEPGFWRSLPAARDGDEHGLWTALAGAGTGTGMFPYSAIAAEVEGALEQGVRSTTSLALLLLAALGLDHYGSNQGALQLAQAALDMAAGQGEPQLGGVRALHAALVAPLAGTLRQAATELASLCEGEVQLSPTSLYLAGTGFAAGMPLPELSRRLDRARSLPAAGEQAGAAALELASRARVLNGLLHQQAAPDLLDLDATAAPPQDTRFGHWLSRLQAAWYAGNHALALQVIDKADVLASPFLPAADRLTYHLFAALSLSHAKDGAEGRNLDLHCAALRRLADNFPASAGAFAALAGAARDRRAGDHLGALRGFESAGAGANRQGQHGLAALAWEQAALQAGECRLDSAVQNYRQQTLASYRRWGALGRVDMLRRVWDQPLDEADAGQAERERILHAGGAGELGLSIAHEVNQPLAAISLHAAAARKWLHREKPNIERALSSLSLISAAGRQAGDIVRSMQRLASRQENEMGNVPVDQAIADTLQLLHRTMRKHRIEIELALGLGDCTIHANRVQLQQVVTNLLVNATEALAGGAAGASRRIRVQTRRYNDHEVEITVADNGPGIALQNRDRVFGSLFSTKPNSTGMGLSISLAIVRAHGGHIEYEPGQPHGACFRFRLPVHPGRRSSRFDDVEAG
jgi:signal transduction histidine kinase